MQHTRFPYLSYRTVYEFDEFLFSELSISRVIFNLTLKTLVQFLC